MMKKIFPVVVIVISLASCTASSNTTEDSLELSIWPDISLAPKIEMKEKIIREDGSVAFTNYDLMKTTKTGSDLSVYIYHYDKSGQCSGDLLGIWHPQNWTLGVQAIWGRVDYFDTQPDFEKEPLCRPFVNGSAYGFCAEKGNTAVVVCVAQVGNNPQLAEDIFKTFRWME